MEAPSEVLHQLLAERGAPEAAASALADEPQRIVLSWRDLIQRHALEALDHFGEALTVLEALQVACLTIGLLFEEEHVEAAREADDRRVYALRQLWAASLQAGGEAVALLRSGYPDGALARWRLIREAEVLALFLIQQPAEVSKDYVAHTAYRALRLRHDYQEWARAAGDEPFGPREMHRMKEDARALRTSDAREWEGDYGWAHAPLLEADADYRAQHSNGRRRRGPTFADLETAVGQRPDKMLWSWASRAVHVSIDATATQQLPLAPRPKELALAGCRVASSLAMPTAMFVCSWPTPPDPSAEFGELAQLVVCLGGEANERFAQAEPDE